MKENGKLQSRLYESCSLPSLSTEFLGEVKGLLHAGPQEEGEK